MRILLVPLSLALLAALLPCSAHARQDFAPVKQAIDEWLKIQTVGLPGQVSWEIGTFDRANQLSPCGRFEIERPAGARPWGRSNLVVRCGGEAGWRIFVPVRIRVEAPYLVSARPIAQGQTVRDGDLATELGDLSELPANTLTELSAVVGRTATTSIPAGRPLRADLFRLPHAVRQGQTVRVVSRGADFAVTNEGRALNNATAGEVVQVRLANGQVLSGIAGPTGSVEVSY